MFYNINVGKTIGIQGIPLGASADKLDPQGDRATVPPPPQYVPISVAQVSELHGAAAAEEAALQDLSAHVQDAYEVESRAFGARAEPGLAVYNQHVGWVMPPQDKLHQVPATGGHLIPPARAVTPAELALNPMALLKDPGPEPGNQTERSAAGQEVTDEGFEDGEHHGLYGRFRASRFGGETGGR